MDAIFAFVASAPNGVKLLARGMGRSYGDAACCAGGYLSAREDFLDVFEFDPVKEELRASSGFSLDEIMRRLIPKGYFVHVTPGTRYVTLGGAIAADIHGKNHHKDGSFINHV
ncbi:FAD linked oxidase domain protein, partial [mine drainage metagenome]